jgi:hypothetical protein
MISKQLIATGCICGALSLGLIAPGTASADAMVTYNGGAGTVSASVTGAVNGEYCRLFIDGAGQSGSGYGLVQSGSVYLSARASAGTHTAQVKCDTLTFDARQVTVTGGGGGNSLQQGNEGTVGAAIENALATIVEIIFPGAAGR